MTRGSRLPPQEQNLFQLIRARRAQAEERGVDLIDLSIGEPRGPALLSAREAAAAAVMSEREECTATSTTPAPVCLILRSCSSRAA